MSEPRCEEVLTSEGVPMSVTAVAQLKIMREPVFLKEAAEQLLGKTQEEI